jgi:hypothetical protein
MAVVLIAWAQSREAYEALDDTVGATAPRGCIVSSPSPSATTRNHPPSTRLGDRARALHRHGGAPRDGRGMADRP